MLTGCVVTGDVPKINLAGTAPRTAQQSP